MTGQIVQGLVDCGEGGGSPRRALKTGLTCHDLASTGALWPLWREQNVGVREGSLRG